MTQIKNYSGYLFTILDADKVDEIICITEPVGYSEVLELDPDIGAEMWDYVLPDSVSYIPWVIGNEELEILLKCGAIKLEKPENVNV